MSNALEQFKIQKIFEIKILGYDISFTNSSLFMLIVFFLLFFTYLYIKLFNSYRTLNTASLKENKDFLNNLKLIDQKIIPNKFSVFVEDIYNMILNMVVSTAGKEALKFVPFIFSLYIFILLSNLVGMFPGTYTSTSQIIITFAISIFIFIAVTVIGFIKHGFHYFSLLLPKGTPLLLMPLMFIVELFAYLARPISLSLRLAANMTAGHIVLKVIASFVIMMGIFGVLPFILLILLTGFEIFIAILQAYIFSILTCVYLNDALNLH